MALFGKKDKNWHDTGAIKGYGDPQRGSEPVAQTFKGPASDKEKYVVVCTGDNHIEFASHKNEVETIRLEMIEKWQGSGICPHILVTKVKEVTEVF